MRLNNMINNILSDIYTQIALVFAAFGGFISNTIFRS